MDCLRSGRDEPAEPAAVEVTLEDTPEPADDEPPKKSRPNKELLGSGCFEGVVAFDGND